MSSTTVTSSILERARSAQAARRAADEEAANAYDLRRQAELRNEWNPIVGAVLAQVKFQLDDVTAFAVDEEGWCTRYYGDGWMLERPAEGVKLDRGDYDSGYTTFYRPLKLTIGKDIRTPVMCWSDGRTKVVFEPAEMIVDEEADLATLWVGSKAMGEWEIQHGNGDLLLAIAEAADKQGEYVTKAHKVELINMERSKQRTTPEPAPQPAQPATDNIESAGKILDRFAADLFCVPSFAGEKAAWEINDGDLADNRAFLIASQIHALAVEVRELRNTMENRP